jgi:hypothetical protein
MIDVDTPGARNTGELYRTGLSWKSLEGYLPRRTAGSNVILEVAYSLTPEEERIANAYQRMRRAAIVRVPFTFGNAWVDKKLANLIEEGGEHCFLFCTGRRLGDQIQGIQSKLRAYGVRDLDGFYREAVVRDFIARADARVLSGGWSADNLGPEMLGTLDTRALLERVAALGGQIPEADRIVFLNWVYGLTASQRYQQVVESLQISGSIGVSDASHPRASAILVYAVESFAPKFRDATYEAKGTFTGWTTSGAHAFPK